MVIRYIYMKEVQATSFYFRKRTKIELGKLQIPLL